MSGLTGVIIFPVCAIGEASWTF